MAADNKTAENDNENFITLEFEDGTELECEIMGIFECGDKEYIALIPDDDSDDVYLYGYKEISEEEFELLDIVDDAEFDEVLKAFEAITVED